MNEPTNSSNLFEETQRYIPGGVNSPVRAYGGVGGTPLFIASGKSARVTDADNNTYIDMVSSWGPLILGHQNEGVREAMIRTMESGWTFGAPTELELVLARMICECVPSIEMVRMVNSGTEATLSALRLARAFTGREKVIKFIGCYHGHHDALLVAAGSGLATLGTPSSPGVTTGTTKDTLLCPYNDPDAIRDLMGKHENEIACIIVEPIAGNMGLVPSLPGFLETLREVCDASGALLIFDEVISGFRVGLGGAQASTSVTPDLTTLGKIIGGGLPVGAYGGRRDIMAAVSPSGAVYQAGTLSGNPLAMAAGIATLDALAEPGVYDTLSHLGDIVVKGVSAFVEANKTRVHFSQLGSMYTLFFARGPMNNFADAERCSTKAYAKYFHAMLARGFYPPPSQFETNFVSTAHSENDAADIAKAICSAAEEALRS